MCLYEDSPKDASSDPSLPQGFETIREIQDMKSHRLKGNPMVSVIGIVKDYRPPIRTKNDDFKCTIEIMDHSVQFESYGIEIHIFWPEDKMPTISGASDIVLIRNAKAQMYKGGVSLLANFVSEFHILPASKIPNSLTASFPWKSTPPTKHKSPSSVENAYVLWTNNNTKKCAIPSTQEFQEKSMQAMHVKDKFRLLKDVKPDSFHNMLGEVIKVLEGNSGALTVYISDYTANTHFYNNVWGEGGATGGRDGDEYGYIKTKPKGTKEWPGPYGKLSIQITMWDGHAAYAREHMKEQDWVLLKNVQLKFGRMGGCLEGFLRGDRNAFEGQNQVQIMKQSEESDGNNARWKDAIRRKREWWKKFEKQKQDILDEAAGLNKKRKAENEGKVKNAKFRRKERRAAADEKIAIAANFSTKFDLNDNVRCSYKDIPTTPISQILTPCFVPSTAPSQTPKHAPFTVRKYRANVRVIDYFPPNIADFAVGRRLTEYDMLSDYSGGESSDVEQDMRNFRSGKGFVERKWEWRFALLVEDASISQPLNSKSQQLPEQEKEKERIWLMVDNESAQMLLGLSDDAANLRTNLALLHNLKEQLFKLWGELEEVKTAKLKALPKPNGKAKKVAPSSSPSFNSTPSSPIQPRKKAGAQPDIDSDSESSPPSKPVLKERNSNISATVREQEVIREQGGGKEEEAYNVRNKAFTCCVRQYGIKVREEDERKADAGEGWRWERKFGLFGCMIV